MTERFTITQDFEEHYRQIRDNGHIIMGCFLEAQAEPIVKLLNELHEQNQYLKSLKWNQDCINEISISIQQRQLLEKENEQLRKENMEYYHLVNCGNCKYHDYDWFDDGDEFEVCEKGHTERLMYNKFCKEWRKL